jgi:hypothetical protein
VPFGRTDCRPYRGPRILVPRAELSSTDRENIKLQISQFAVNLVDGLSVVQAERDADNLPDEKLAPPVMPAEIVKMRTGVFIREVLDPYRVHIAQFWDADTIDNIEKQHKLLVSPYNYDRTTKSTLDGHIIRQCSTRPWMISNQVRTSLTFAAMSGDWLLPLPIRRQSRQITRYRSGRRTKTELH